MFKTIRILTFLTVIFLTACGAQQQKSDVPELLPLAQGKLTFIFFYTDN